MDDALRVTPEEAHEKVESGEALLVCAYEDEAKCRQMRLENALTMDELRGQLEREPRDRQIIFYCA